METSKPQDKSKPANGKGVPLVQMRRDCLCSCIHRLAAFRYMTANRFVAIIKSDCRRGCVRVERCATSASALRPVAQPLVRASNEEKRAASLDKRLLEESSRSAIVEKMPKILLVIGRSGQLATELSRLSAPEGVMIVNAGRELVDLSRPVSVANEVSSLRPAAVINAAAYTAVDKAESEPEIAFALNRDGPAELARACALLGVPLVHISTDYVFDGTKQTPYIETDKKTPLGIYGKSKSDGEDAVLAAGADATVIRTSWLYASHGANFLRTMLRLAETRNEIGVVSDQLGRPTWAKDLALAAIVTAMRSRNGDLAARGIFHYCGAGDATWADFAQAVFEGARARGVPSSTVRRIATADFPTAAKRPANSRLDTGKIERTLGVAVRPWRAATDLCLDELALQNSSYPHSNHR